MLFCVFATQTLVFLPKTKNRSVVSVSRIHSKKSKVVNNPKNNPIFTHKVVTHPKNTPKNIPKVGATYQISNIIPSQICPYHKDKYCPQYTNKIIKLSVLHAHTINLSTQQNIAITTTSHSYPHYNIKLSTLSHIVFNTTYHSLKNPSLFNSSSISILRN